MTTTPRPWLDASLPADRRARLLLDAMTREEKVAQMVQISYSIVTSQEADEWARLGAGSFLHILGDDARRIQRLATESRLGVPVIFGIDAIHGHGIHNGATIFPTQLTLAASWDPALAERMGRVTAREVTAEGLHWVFSPVFCLARDLRWGRVDETFGEDPLLAGTMGAALVRGYQGDDLRAEDSVVACAKHYIAYGESTGGRDSYDSSVTMRAIRSTFLPPFQRAIEAGCLTVMAGYEPIDGIPCSAHAPLLRRVLKEELGFDGFVVTDWQNVLSMVRRQKIAKDMTEASKIALEAGNDMIMTAPEFYEATLGLLARGEVDERLVDDAVLRILSVKFRIGLFDVPAKVKTLTLRDDPTARDAADTFGHADHLEESLEAARRSIVLLKNGTVAGKPALPIDGRKKIRTIAVIGPNADSVRAQFGDWTFFTHPVPHLDAIPTFRVTTVLDGIKELAQARGIRVLFDKGCDVLDPAVHSIPRARKLASKADLVILCVGDTLILNGEAHDRADLALTGAQDELAREVGSVCARRGVPLVSVLVNGKPLEFGEVAEVSDAVLEAFNTGTLGGRAVAEILFGERDPEGRLPVSFPRKTGQLPVYYNQLPGWHEGRYLDCEPTPLFAFGEGLSYSPVSYGEPRLSAARARAGDTVLVRVGLRNEGDRDSVETVQVYAADLVASVVTPVRELKAFKKVTVPAGSALEVEIPLEVSTLSVVTADERVVVEPGDFEILVGRDSRPESLRAALLTVEGQ